MAIAALLLPAAIAASTSRSRGVSAVERRVVLALLALEQHPHHRRVDHRAAARDDLDRRLQLAAVVHAVLEQVGAALGAVGEQVEAVARLGVLAEHDDPDLGVGLAQACATRMPSSSPDGGMRTSVTTTSGCVRSTSASSVVPSLQSATISTSS